MKNLQLAAIFTRPEFLSACMLIILMDSQTKKGQTGKGQTTISGPRLGSDHLNVTPHTQWKQEREQLVKKKVQFSWGHDGLCGLRVPCNPRSESERMRSHSEWGKMLPSGAPGEIFFLKKSLGGVLHLQRCHCCQFSSTDLQLSFCCSNVLLFCVAHQRLPCKGIGWISKQTGWKSAFSGGLHRRKISLNIHVVFKVMNLGKTVLDKVP